MSISSFKKLSGLFVFCVAVVIVETIASHPPRWLLEIGLASSSPADDDAFRFLAKQKSFGEEKPGIALVGSSQIREGLDAVAIERAIKQRCNLDWQVSNFGVSAGGGLDLVFAMDAIREKSPEIIVAWPAWRNFYLDNIQLNLHYYADSKMRMLELLALLFQEGELPDQFSVLSQAYLSVLLPSSRWTRSFRLPSLLRTHFSNDSRPSREFVHNQPAPPVRVERILERYRDHSKRISTGHLEKVYQRFLEGSTARVRAQGIEVVFIDAYNSPAFEEIRSLAEVRQNYSEYLKNLAKRYQTRSLSAEEMPRLDAGSFADPTHVNQRGRETLTTYLAEYLITNHLDGVHADCK